MSDDFLNISRDKLFQPQPISFSIHRKKGKKAVCVSTLLLVSILMVVRGSSRRSEITTHGCLVLQR